RELLRAHAGRREPLARRRHDRAQGALQRLARDGLDRSAARRRALLARERRRLAGQRLPQRALELPARATRLLVARARLPRAARRRDPLARLGAGRIPMSPARADATKIDPLRERLAAPELLDARGVLASAGVPGLLAHAHDRVAAMLDARVR